MEEQTITNVPVENSQQTLKKNKTKIFSLIALIALCVLVTLSFIFSIEIDGTYIIEETATLLTLCLIPMGLLIPILIIYFKSGRKFNIAQIVLFSVFIVITIAIIIMTMVTYVYIADILARKTDLDYMYYSTLTYFWLVFTTAIISLTLATLTFIFNLITFVRERKASKNVDANETSNEVNSVSNNNSTKDEENNTLTFDTSNMVRELTEVKNVYDQKLITEEEYNNIRASIIAKYYKQ